MPSSNQDETKGEVKERIKQMHDSITAGGRSLCCPFCEVYDLEPFGHNAARCPSCGSLISGALLETLHQISELSDVAGQPTCECGEPEMRCLPDGVYWVYWCPSCGSEVLPLSRFSLSRSSEQRFGEHKDKPPSVQKIRYAAYTPPSQYLS